jgi:AhpD family alkylhydroperoxidase
MMKRGPFPKRTYGSLAELLSDLSAILSYRGHVKQALRGDLVSPAFRERLMLVVTQINDCRYCSKFHAAQAFNVGVTEKDISMLQVGVIPVGTPQSEMAALQFARHWAERNANPDPAEQTRLEETYSPETANAIRIL